VRHETRSVFTREALESASNVLVATTAVILLLTCIVEMDALHGFFTTTDLSSGQWLTCVGIASSVLWVGELSKLIARATARLRARKGPRRPRRARSPGRLSRAPR
jgi:Ca2+-transporting ATPase